MNRLYKHIKEGLDNSPWLQLSGREEKDPIRQAVHDLFSRTNLWDSIWDLEFDDMDHCVEVYNATYLKWIELDLNAAELQELNLCTEHELMEWFTPL